MPGAAQRREAAQDAERVARVVVEAEARGGARDADVTVSYAAAEALGVGSQPRE